MDLIQAQWAIMEALAEEDTRRVEIAAEHVSQCMDRLRRAALALDRLLTERGDDEGLRKLVESALRLTDHVGAGRFFVRNFFAFCADRLVNHAAAA